jgi:hypothetical protein
MRPIRCLDFLHTMMVRVIYLILPKIIKRIQRVKIKQKRAPKRNTINRIIPSKNSIITKSYRFKNRNR